MRKPLGFACAIGLMAIAGCGGSDDSSGSGDTEQADPVATVKACLEDGSGKQFKTRNDTDSVSIEGDLSNDLSSFVQVAVYRQKDRAIAARDLWNQEISTGNGKYDRKVKIGGDPLIAYYYYPKTITARDLALLESCTDGSS